MIADVVTIVVDNYKGIAFVKSWRNKKSSIEAYKNEPVRKHCLLTETRSKILSLTKNSASFVQILRIGIVYNSVTVEAEATRTGAQCFGVVLERDCRQEYDSFD